MKFLLYIRTYFEAPEAPGVLSSKRVNGFLALIVATVIGLTTQNLAITGAFLGLVGAEGIAIGIGNRK